MLEYARAAVFKVNWPDYEADVARLPAGYSAPDGAVLVATIDGVPAGCVGLRRFEADRCEMKRLHVRPSARRDGVGRAFALYLSLGFDEIPAYCENPEPDVRFFRLALNR